MCSRRRTPTYIGVNGVEVNRVGDGAAAWRPPLPSVAHRSPPIAHRWPPLPTGGPPKATAKSITATEVATDGTVVEDRWPPMDYPGLSTRVPFAFFLYFCSSVPVCGERCVLWALGLAAAEDFHDDSCELCGRVPPLPGQECGLPEMAFIHRGSLHALPHRSRCHRLLHQ